MRYTDEQKRWPNVRGPMLLGLAAILGGCLDEGLPQCPEWRAGGAIDCEDAPELCDLPVTHLSGAPDAIRVVFVGDGFGPGDREVYIRWVDRLIEGLLGDASTIVGRAPERFAFHRVDLFADDGAHLLGACAGDRSSGDVLKVDDRRVALASTAAGPAQVVVVLVDTDGLRASAGGFVDAPTVKLTRSDDFLVLDHELGHALVGLGDEYVDGSGRYTPPAFAYSSWPHPEPYLTRDAPNLSIYGDGRRWAELADGARAGSGGYASGVYHPPYRCRMGAGEANRFCPVCDHAIDAWLAGGEGPTTCEITVAMEDGLHRIHAGPPPGWPGRVEATLQGGTRAGSVVGKGPRGTVGMLAFDVDERSIAQRLHARCVDEKGRTTWRAVDVVPDGAGGAHYAEVDPADRCDAGRFFVASPGRWSTRVTGPFPPPRMAGRCGERFRSLHRFEAPAAGRYRVTAHALDGAPSPGMLVRATCGIAEAPDEAADGFIGCVDGTYAGEVMVEADLSEGDPLFVWLDPGESAELDLRVSLLD